MYLMHVYPTYNVHDMYVQVSLKMYICDIIAFIIRQADIMIITMVSLASIKFGEMALRWYW